jgi:hypothetical protein
MSAADLERAMQAAREGRKEDFLAGMRHYFDREVLPNFRDHFIATNPKGAEIAASDDFPDLAFAVWGQRISQEMQTERGANLDQQRLDELFGGSGGLGSLGPTDNDWGASAGDWGG